MKVFTPCSTPTPAEVKSRKAACCKMFNGFAGQRPYDVAIASSRPRKLPSSFAFGSKLARLRQIVSGPVDYELPPDGKRLDARCGKQIAKTDKKASSRSILFLQLLEGFKSIQRPGIRRSLQSSAPIQGPDFIFTKTEHRNKP